MPKKNKKEKPNFTYPTEELFKRIDELEKKIDELLLKADKPLYQVFPPIPNYPIEPIWINPFTITCGSSGFIQGNIGGSACIPEVKKKEQK